MVKKMQQFFEDVYGRKIRFTIEPQAHLENDHPEMTGQNDKIRETLFRPSTIKRSRTDQAVQLFYRKYQSTPVTEKYLCVVVKVLDQDCFIITAYFTDQIKRGDLIWGKE